MRMTLRSQLDADSARHDQPYPPALLAQIAQARKERARNQAREALRERRGETVLRLLHRQRQGTPAHILTTMSPEARRADKVVRSVSEVGYVGMMKSRLNRGMCNPERWAVLEKGRSENRKALDSAAQEIMEENNMRNQRNNADQNQ